MTRFEKNKIKTKKLSRKRLTRRCGGVTMLVYLGDVRELEERLLDREERQEAREVYDDNNRAPRRHLNSM